MTKHLLRGVVCSAFLLALTGCGDGGSSHAATLAELEARMHATLDALVTDADFTLLLKAENGHTFGHSTGSSSPTVSYRSASTSKWVTAAVILSLVEDGVLALDDRPQDFIGTWPTTGNLSLIELHHLLSFTSGLAADPPCLIDPMQDFATCVDAIASANSGAVAPGSEFHYGSSHLQVAGLMAVRATGASDWGEVFDAFRADTGLFASAAYDVPSAQNPLLAGGMHWTAEEYLEYLDALYEEIVLGPVLFGEMTRDQILGVPIAQTPVVAIGEDWHYGYGSWIECHAVSFDCPATTKVSSPGAYGAYPFIDFEHGYFGILAREGILGTFAEGYDAFASVEPLLQQWAALNRP